MLFFLSFFMKKIPYQLFNFISATSFQAKSFLLDCAVTFLNGAVFMLLKVTFFKLLKLIFLFSSDNQLSFYAINRFEIIPYSGRKTLLNLGGNIQTGNRIYSVNLRCLYFTWLCSWLFRLSSTIQNHLVTNPGLSGDFYFNIQVHLPQLLLVLSPVIMLLGWNSS